jgi:hypothetical protein
LLVAANVAAAPPTAKARIVTDAGYGNLTATRAQGFEGLGR